VSARQRATRSGVVSRARCRAPRPPVPAGMRRDFASSSARRAAWRLGSKPSAARRGPPQRRSCAAGAARRPRPRPRRSGTRARARQAASAELRARLVTRKVKAAIASQPTSLPACLPTNKPTNRTNGRTTTWLPACLLPASTALGHAGRSRQFKLDAADLEVRARRAPRSSSTDRAARASSSRGCARSGARRALATHIWRA
jgi:hypothetical protein